jgi:hypothetical protein
LSVTCTLPFQILSPHLCLNQVFLLCL